MKQHFRGLVPHLVVLVAGSSFAATAQGASIAPRPIVPITITPVAPPLGAPQAVGQSNLATLCAQPVSATTCAIGDYVLSCATAYPATHTPTECGSLLANAYQASWAASQPATLSSAILPLSMTQQTGVPYQGTVQSALPVASNTVTPILLGNQASYGGAALLATAQFVAATSAPRYAPQAAGALTMNSCAEYAWKKWGDYSWFNDIAHAAGTWYDWIVSPPNQANLAAMLGPNVQRADHRSIAFNQTTITQATSLTRNPFFTFVPPWFASSSDPVQKAIYAAIIARQLQPSIALPQSEVAWAPGQLAMMNAAGVGNPSFANNEQRMNAYAALLWEYEGDQNEIADAQEAISLLMTGGSGGMGTRAYVTRLNQPPAAGGHPPEGPIDHLLPMTAARREAIGARVANLSPGRIAGVRDGDIETVAPPGSTSRMHTESTSSVSSALAYYKAMLAALEADRTAVIAKITTALMQEWAYDTRNGCFGYTYLVNGVPTTVAVNSCDWTPHEYAERYVDAFAGDVQYAYAECLDDTGDQWSTTVDAPPQPLFGFSDMTAPYNTQLTTETNGPSTEHTDKSVEQFFFNYENRDAIEATFQADEAKLQAQYKAETTSLPMQGPAGAPTSIGQTMQDQNSIGGDWFGASYGYTAGWSVTPIIETQAQANAYADKVPHICSMSGDAYATLKAAATILKQNITLVDGALEVTVQPNMATLKQAHMTILGNDYMAAPLSSAGLAQGVGIGGDSISIPVDDTPMGGGFSTIIPVFGIPLEVGAGVTVQIGTNLNVTTSPPPTCDRNSVAFSMATSLVPYASADAKAWVGIDLGVVSAGVEGDVNLVTVSLPINASVSLATPGDPNKITLVVDQNANLQMSELSGSVDVYAEISLGFWSDRTDVSLFSWDGFHQTMPLYAPITQSYPLEAVNFRMNAANFDPSAVTP